MFSKENDFARLLLFNVQPYEYFNVVIVKWLFFCPISRCQLIDWREQICLWMLVKWGSKCEAVPGWGMSIGELPSFYFLFVKVFSSEKMSWFDVSRNPLIVWSRRIHWEERVQIIQTLNAHHLRVVLRVENGCWIGDCQHWFCQVLDIHGIIEKWEIPLSVETFCTFTSFHGNHRVSIKPFRVGVSLIICFRVSHKNRTSDRRCWKIQAFMLWHFELRFYLSDFQILILLLMIFVFKKLTYSQILSYMKPEF